MLVAMATKHKPVEENAENTQPLYRMKMNYRDCLAFFAMLLVCLMVGILL